MHNKADNCVVKSLDPAGLQERVQMCLPCLGAFWGLECDMQVQTIHAMSRPIAHAKLSN